MPPALDDVPLGPARLTKTMWPDESQTPQITIPVPQMVEIPSGTGWMGSGPNEAHAEGWEQPRHEIRIERPFLLGKYAVTFAEFDVFCAATARRKPRDLGFGRDRRPVINVTHVDAEAYCEWLNAEAGPGWRLPSEAEWEYACRAGSSGAYSFVGMISPDHANYDVTDGAGGTNPRLSRQQTIEVGTLPHNGWGLHEMHGNVWEWCADAWTDGYDDAPTDGSAWMIGDITRAPTRGGSWMNEATYLRSAARLGVDRKTKSARIGFRVARSIQP